MKTINKANVFAVIETLPARSAWKRGVKEYAFMLLDNIPEDFDEVSLRIWERALLNGAHDWRQYSWGGCAYCYNGDICAALCTPSEQWKTKYGVLRPNSREEWLDVQARALYQACALILETVEGMKNN